MNDKVQEMRFFVTEFTLSDNNEILHFAQNDTSEGFLRMTGGEGFRRRPEQSEGMTCKL